MALRLRRRARTHASLEGTARVDARTKDLLKRIEPGEIAVIRHENLDRIAADGLIEAKVLAVVNASPSANGRYPNRGPLRVVEAGIPLIDVDDPGLLDRVREGSLLRVEGGEIWCGNDRVAEGHVLTAAELEETMETARLAIGAELERFAENTLEYIHREARLFFEPLTVPPLRTQCQGRHALVVVRGHDYRSDLAALRPYIREYRPVLFGVDGGADALLEFGFTPDVIIGDFDSLSPRAMHCGAELVHHVHPDGRAPGREALLDSGVDYHEFVAEGTSEDVAMLLANELHATLIVAVGTHASMVEFLDKGRRGMASTFLTRLRLGPILVDAKGVNQLYQGRVRRMDVVLLIGAALLAIVVVGIVAEPIHVFLRGFWVTIKDIVGS
jgi:uncharacterized membrane-anchored protein